MLTTLHDALTINQTFYTHHFERKGPIRNNESWTQSSDNVFTPYRGPLLNPTFINDEEPRQSPSREIGRPEYKNPAFDRSYSWLHSQPPMNSRPFSYLEDIKRSSSTKRPVSSKDSMWPSSGLSDRWLPKQPPVPAPDYSPDAPRRLKSALKSSYM